jgi:hypothetical protein
VPDLERLLDLEFVPRSVAILQHLTQGEIALSRMQSMVESAFNFPVKTVRIDRKASR